MSDQPSGQSEPRWAHVWDHPSLSALSAMEANWDTYGAVPISYAALTTADTLAFVPMPDGGIQIELHAGGADIEIEITSTGKVQSVYVIHT